MELVIVMRSITGSHCLKTVSWAFWSFSTQNHFYFYSTEVSLLSDTPETNLYFVRQKLNWDKEIRGQRKYFQSTHQHQPSCPRQEPPHIPYLHRYHNPIKVSIPYPIQVPPCNDQINHNPFSQHTSTQSVSSPLWHIIDAAHQRHVNEAIFARQFGDDDTDQTAGWINYYFAESRALFSWEDSRGMSRRCGFHSIRVQKQLIQ